MLEPGAAGEVFTIQYVLYRSHGTPSFGTWRNGR